MSDKFGEFIDAVQRGDSANVRRLCKREFINDIRKDGWTALISACCYGNVDIVKYLLSEGAYIEIEFDHGIGFKPIHFAARMGHTSVMTTLIENGCSLDCVDIYGRTPLDVAMEYEKEECVRILRSALTTKEKDIAERLLKENNLSKIVGIERGRTLLGLLLDYHDMGIMEEIRSKTVDEQKTPSTTADCTNHPGAQPGDQLFPICSICASEPINCTLNCGHVFCMTCAEKDINCYMCRVPITARIKMFS